MSRGLLDSASDSSCEEHDNQNTQVTVPTVEIDNPEIAHSPSQSELRYILDCGLQSPFLSTNWSRVVGASLRFRTCPDQHGVS
jgi:hypothetical protein